MNGPLTKLTRQQKEERVKKAAVRSDAEKRATISRAVSGVSARAAINFRRDVRGQREGG